MSSSHRLALPAALTFLASAAALAAAAVIPSTATAVEPPVVNGAVGEWQSKTSGPAVRRISAGSARVTSRARGRAFAVSGSPGGAPVAADYDVIVPVRAERDGMRVCVRATTARGRAVRTCTDARAAWRTVRVRVPRLQEDERVTVTVTGRARFAAEAFRVRAASLALTPASARAIVARPRLSDSATSAQSPPAATAPSASPSLTYFRTLPVGASNIPRPDSECAQLVRRHSWEPRDVARSGHISNLAANASVPSGAWPFGAFKPISSPEAAKRAERVTGNFSGTTDEILQWAACKWGLNEDWSRAQAVKESNWWQDARGDWVSACNSFQSFGIFQVRDMRPDCVTKNWGGMPHSLNMTALNADFFHMVVRAYFEGWFNHWADTAQAVGNERNARGLWFSGGSLAGASSYMSDIDGIRSRRDWTNSTTYKAGYPWPVVSD